MAIEIERKFLVETKNFKYNRKFKINQGYIFKDENKVVRIRQSEFGCFITIKINRDNISKYEYEYEIPQKDAEELLSNCVDIIEKTRHLYNDGKYYWEIDKFHGELEGLIIAEIELKNSEEKVETPYWCVKEITGDSRYYNSNLLDSKRNNLI